MSLKRLVPNVSDRRVFGIFTLATILFIPSGGTAQAMTVFAGLPGVKISEGGVERIPESVSRDRAVNLACAISRIGDQYYWASRENKEIIKKVRCIELKPVLQRENQPWLVDSMFYSAQLDTCVLTKRFIQKNATIVVIEDALTGASILVDRNINGKSL